MPDTITFDQWADSRDLTSWERAAAWAFLLCRRQQQYAECLVEWVREEGDG